jgi:hypothetical protein
MQKEYIIKNKLDFDSFIKKYIIQKDGNISSYYKRIY